MSVTSLLQDAEVRRRIDAITPSYERRVAADIRVPVMAKGSEAILGTAFDYALRFELKRRFQRAKTNAWIAELSAVALSDRTKDPQYLAARRAVAEARRKIGAYVLQPSPTARDRESMVAHSVRLARLDAIYRAGKLDITSLEPTSAEVAEVVRLLEIVPYATFDRPQILLNPTFGAASVVVGGADADAIVGDLLIDFKVTSTTAIERRHVRQLVAYYVLARHHRAKDIGFPLVSRLGLYLARHAHLWVMEAREIDANKAFSDFEGWFMEHFRQDDVVL